MSKNLPQKQKAPQKKEAQGSHDEHPPLHSFSPETVRIFRIVLTALLLISAVAELALRQYAGKDAMHPHFDIEDMPVFHAIYGFISCAAIIFASKALGLFVKQEES